MNFTKEQRDILHEWERPMRIAVYSHYLRGIGSSALNTMVGIYNSVVKTPIMVNGNCANCIYDFLVSIGRMYFADLEECEKHLVERKEEDKPSKTTSKELKAEETAQNELKTKLLKKQPKKVK